VESASSRPSSRAGPAGGGRRDLRRRRRPAKLAELATRIVTHVRYEWLLGLDTAGRIRLEDLGVAAPGRENYSPVSWAALRRALPHGGLGSDDVLLDLGAGKGRMLLMAGRHPIRRMIGVEISPELAAVARANLDRAASRLRCPRVEIVIADAASYRVPDDVTVVHMFNPFSGPVLAAALDRLLESIDSSPRTIRLIYSNPREDGHELIIGSGRASLVRQAQPLIVLGSALGDMAVRVYRLGPRQLEPGLRSGVAASQTPASSASALHERERAMQSRAGPLTPRGLAGEVRAPGSAANASAQRPEQKRYSRPPAVTQSDEVHSDAADAGYANPREVAP